jgi:eukaryotic translation initiation factor 2C
LSRDLLWGDTKAGIQTICITQDKAGSLSSPQIQANIAFKVNAKLGGRNHVLPVPLENDLHRKSDKNPTNSTMVVGADVTHPGVGSVAHCPSIAAVIASCDEYAVAYPGSLRLQRSKQEMIEDLTDMICERLHVWHKHSASAAANGTLPSAILFYRDGVSEIQFASVKREELSRIKLGCDKAARELKVANYKPAITLVVCTKRHHTRFFPPKDELPDDQKWVLDYKSNFKPGLLVDDPAILSPWHFDVYLQSQAALNGTARPCHYSVVHNEMWPESYSRNAIKNVSFNLCWIYATALTPISFAAPAYYAVKLCDRGRCYLRPLLKLRDDQRPDDDVLDKEMRRMSNFDTASDEEKDDFFCDLLKSGWGDFWPMEDRKNPQHGKLDDSMFYV